MPKHAHASTVVGIAWYRPEEYSAVKAFCEDRDTMDTTYEIWRRGVEKVERELRADGTEVVRIDFSLADFKLWSSTHAQKANASSRSAFTSLKLRERYSG
jgi:hypothetical protein